MSRPILRQVLGASRQKPMVIDLYEAELGHIFSRDQIDVLDRGLPVEVDLRGTRAAYVDLFAFYMAHQGLHAPQPGVM